MGSIVHQLHKNDIIAKLHISRTTRTILLFTGNNRSNESDFKIAKNERKVERANEYISEGRQGIPIEQNRIRTDPSKHSSLGLIRRGHSLSSKMDTVGRQKYRLRYFFLLICGQIFPICDILSVA